MDKIFSYTADKNNCFILKHSENQSLDDIVESLKINDKTISVNYNKPIKIEQETKLIFEEYNKFGIIVQTTEYEVKLIETYGYSANYSIINIM